VVGLSTIAFVFMIRKLYIEFGWAVFHLVGASPQMKRECCCVAGV
jgi:gamma-glutamylcysteine synthetase